MRVIIVSDKFDRKSGIKKELKVGPDRARAGVAVIVGQIVVNKEDDFTVQAAFPGTENIHCVWTVFPAEYLAPFLEELPRVDDLILLDPPPGRFGAVALALMVN